MAKPQETPQEKIPTIQVTSQKKTSSEKKEPTGFSQTIALTKQSVQTLAEQLRQEVGIQIRSLGSLGAGSYVSIRGSHWNQVEIYLNGMPLQTGLEGSINLENIPSIGSTEIEVYKSFSPLQKGGGIGGSIHFNFLQKKTQRLEFTSTISSFQTGNLQAHYADHYQKWSWMLNASYLATSGGFLYYNDQGTPYNLTDDKAEEYRTNNHFQQAQLVQLLQFKPNSTLRFQWNNVLLASIQGLPGLGVYKTYHAQFQKISHWSQFSLEKKGFGKIPWKINHQLYFQQQYDHLDDASGEIALSPEEQKQFYWAVGSQLDFFLFPWAWMEWLISSRFRVEWFQTEKQEKLALHRKRLEWFPGIQMTNHLWKERMTLLGSFRLPVFLQQKGDSNEWSLFSFWEGRLGLRFRPVSWLQIKANGGRYSRFPTLFEWFGNNGSSKGNQNLLPEIGWSWDVGLQTQLLPSTVKAWKWSLQYAMFGVHSNHLIRWVQNSQNTFLPVNIEQTQSIGHEVSTQVSWKSKLRLLLQFTQMTSQNLSSSLFENGKQLPGRAPWDVFAKLSWKSFGIRFYYDFQWIASSFLDLSNLRSIPQRFLHGLGFSLSPHKILQLWGIAFPWPQLKITFSIQNLLNQQTINTTLQEIPWNGLQTIQNISEFSGYPLPGRNFSFSVEFRFSDFLPKRNL